jgi:phage repressor protein C with HTH and peptisase S24 domain
MQTLGERLLMARKEKKMTQQDLARKAGLTQATISDIERGRNQTTVEAPSLAKALGISVDYLLTGKNYTVKAGHEFDVTGLEETFPRPATGENFAIIPYYDAKASCGNGYFNDHIELKNGLAFSRKWLTKRGLHEENLIIIGASGDSMWPTFSNGATLLVNRVIDKPKSGKVYLITENGEERVKRLFQEFTGEWRIASDNPNKAIYPDTTITTEQMQDLKITGQVVWFDGEL